MRDDAERPAPARARRLRQAAVGAVGVVAVYGAIVLLADAGALADAMGRLRPAAIALALALVVLVFAIRSLRWRLYLGQLDVLAPQGPIAFAPAFAMGLPQGKWGQLVKAWALRARARTPYPRAVPAIFAERVSDVLGGLLHLAVGLALVPGFGARVLVGALAFVAVLVLVLRSAAAARALVRALSWIPWVRTHAENILDGHARLRGHLTVRELAAPSVMALAAFLVESLALWAIASPGLGLPISIAHAILFVAIADAAATASFLPGGVGAAEGSLIFLIALQGVPLAEAAAVTLIYRAATLWFGIGLGVLGAAYLALAPAGRVPPASAAPSGRT